MTRRFNHLHVPDQWTNMWSRYPQGYTILEALLNWVKQVDDLSDNVNTWNDYLDEFVETYDKRHQDTVTALLNKWRGDGTLEDIINKKVFDMKMDKGQTISFNQLDKSSVKFDETWFKPETVQQWTGNTPVGTVPADGSITPKKLSFKPVAQVYARNLAISAEPTGNSNNELEINFVPTTAFSNNFYWYVAGEGYTSHTPAVTKYFLEHNQALIMNIKTNALTKKSILTDTMTTDELMLLLNIDGAIVAGDLKHMTPQIQPRDFDIYLRGKAFSSRTAKTVKITIENEPGATGNIYWLRPNLTFKSKMIDTAYTLNHNEYLAFNPYTETVTLKDITKNKTLATDVLLALNISGVIVAGILRGAIQSSQSREKQKPVGNFIATTELPITGAPNGGCVVGDEYWLFDASADDHSNYANCRRFTINEDYTLTLKDSFTHNWGHVNSISYNEQTDTLVLGNGSGDYQLAGKLFIVPNASLLSGQASLNAVAITINLAAAEWGAKTNVVWGEPNNDQHNIVYVLTDDNKNVRRVLLEKTGNSFNGNYRLLKHFSQEDGGDVIQGAVFADGFLYVGLGHDGIWYAKQWLNTDTTITKEVTKTQFYNNDGSLVSCFMEDISAYKDKLFLRMVVNSTEKIFVVNK